jgi:hypothetical protein
MNYPKNPNDLYLFGGLFLSAIGVGIYDKFPAADFTVRAGFWVSEFWAGVLAVRWVGAAVLSDVDNARTMLKIRLNTETVEPKPQEEKPAEGYTPINRPLVNSMKTAMATNMTAVDMPTLNLQTHFFTVILKQYDLDPVGQSKVDVTETRWARERKVFSQTQLSNMKIRAKEIGAFKRESDAKRSRFLVADRAIVEWLTKNPLPL